MRNLFEANGAFFSPCRKYRYALWRIWDETLPRVMFVGLNPSTANEVETDPTITRVRYFASKWGYGGFYMMNLFAYVTPYPEELKLPEAHDWLNDKWLRDISSECETIVYAYGNFKQAVPRAGEVRRFLGAGMALVINKNGTPRHPLYVHSDTKLIPF